MNQPEDTSLASEQAEVQPSGQQPAQDLSSSTPTQPNAQLPKRRKRHTALFIVLGIIFVLGVTYGTFYVLHALQMKTNAKTSATSQSATTKATPTSTDSSINTSLEGIDKDITQSNADQSDANSAVTDSDQQITVPTE